jgi:hypothetical protein
MDLHMKKLLTLILLLTFTLSACGTLEVGLEPTDSPVSPASTDLPLIPPPTLTAAPVSTAEPAPLTLDVLANAEYHSAALEADEANFQLEDGIHYIPHLPEESDSAWFISLSNRMAYGDLNADGVQDAAVILESQRGGSGHFRELAVVLNQDGKPFNVASTYLGDRVGINSIDIQSGIIILDMVVHGPNDPLMGPSVKATFKYQLVGDQLVDLDPNAMVDQIPTFTPVPSGPQPTPVCPISWFFTFKPEQAAWGYTCPSQLTALNAIGQDFEGGRVIWMAPDPASMYGTVYVIYNSGEWVTYVDGWDPSQPSTDPSIVPPTDRYQPVDAIGKVWRENADVRNQLGWAFETQVSFVGRYQTYASGGDSHYIFFDHGKWGLVLLLNSVDMGPNTWAVVGGY